ncbi:hypothetical protein GCM10027517_23030 [Phycicoccus ginsengisoli]
MQVKDLAALAGTSVRTIRYYHQLGLLAVPESGSTWRSYGFAHLTRLMRIRWLVDAGVPLAEVPHMLRPPDGADERAVVIEDLNAVLASIDAKRQVLDAQHARVMTLRDRVVAQGRLSPLPEAVVRLYAALLERQLPPGMQEAVLRERELLEMACYAGPIPADVLMLVEALSDSDIDEVCLLWRRCHDLDQASDSKALTADQIVLADDIVLQIAALAERVAPQAAQRLLEGAATLDRPQVRAAVNLAYPSATYRQVFASLVRYAKDRSQP